jgi:hypothetical protein
MIQAPYDCRMVNQFGLLLVQFIHGCLDGCHLPGFMFDIAFNGVRHEPRTGAVHSLGHGTELLQSF